eukprot:gnl/Spiro4/16610_TR8946_c0_g2_i1.p2 gnl/Spiro4/16610_TR8946_c0_g2~~gnl/Spiro4/16610_TR8946_c0_g2_i1.p2  ORF type:complete len:418 (-),score=72.94 gnl/Spiro4/16610_TR8946_c0_g2_i1:34-1287(-)
MAPVEAWTIVMNVSPTRTTNRRTAQRRSPVTAVKKAILASTSRCSFWWCPHVFFAHALHSSSVEKSTLDQVMHEAVTLTPHSDLLGAAGRLVHLPGVNPIPSTPPLRDEDFGIEFPGAAIVQREVEYCQWQQVSHQTKRLVGKEPSQCILTRDSTNPACKDAQAANACAAVFDRNACNSYECCSFQEGADIYDTETSYEYFLDWHSAPIPSTFFHDRMSYDNPQRNPFPAYTRRAPHAVVPAQAALFGDSKYFPTQSLSRVGITPSHVATVRPHALREGFWDVSSTWFYSDYSKLTQRSTWADIAEKGFNYMVEGVWDTGMKGKCTPGDIRIGFRSASFVPTVTVVARLSERDLVPYKTYANEVFYVVPGTVGLKDVLDERSAAADSYVWWTGFFTVAFLALVAYLFFSSGSKNPKP